MAEQKKTLDQLAMDYQLVSSTPEGKRVFADLKRFCGFQTDLSATDARVQDAQVAKHAVAVRIHKMTKRRVR